jgi:hypothetical protein
MRTFQTAGHAEKDGMGAALTRDKIAALAPDQSALSASIKLQKPASWPLLGHDGGDALIWGECQGSGATPYRVMADLRDLGNKCTCPSRKFPCKHVLALLSLSIEAPGRFTQGETPPWVGEWLTRRRGPKKAGGEGDEQKAATGRGASFAIAESAASAPKPVDPKAAERAEAQRVRLREEREASIAGGLDELDRWVLDRLEEGLANFAATAQQACRSAAARLIDAKAPGIAGMVDELAVKLFRVPQPLRAAYAMERLSAIALLASAYRNQAGLTEALRADVRRLIGWTVRREELLEDKDALRVGGRWQVVSARSEVQPDRIRRLETWLLRLGARQGAEPDFALLLDFVPLAGGPSAPPFYAGEVLSAELAFYPSAVPLRAQIVTRAAAEGEAGWGGLPDIATALDGWDRSLAHQPWLESWPLLIGGVHVARGNGDALWLEDGAGGALPLDMAKGDAMAPLIGLPGITAAGLWDGQCFELLAAETPIGGWYGG